MSKRHIATQRSIATQLFSRYPVTQLLIMAGFILVHIIYKNAGAGSRRTWQIVLTPARYSQAGTRFSPAGIIRRRQRRVGARRGPRVQATTAPLIHAAVNPRATLPAKLVALLIDITARWTLELKSFGIDSSLRCSPVQPYTTHAAKAIFSAIVGTTKTAYHRIPGFSFKTQKQLHTACSSSVY